jgi:beta-lactamase class A
MKIRILLLGWVGFISCANAVVIKDDLNSKLSQLELSNNIRIGAYAIDTSNNNRVSFNGITHFPFCSTVKFMTVATLLKNTESTPNKMNQVILYNDADTKRSGWSPITSKHIESGMTLSSLSQAALNYSDNTAQNLIVNYLGGVDVVNKFARSIGDNQFHLDRNEPELNTAIPNDKRDTTTPQSMSNSMIAILFGNVLKEGEKIQLTTWLKNNTTGSARIKAGLPESWTVGDKTGTCNYGTANDIAVIYPPNCAPIVLSIYTIQNKKDALPQESILAETTRLVSKELAKNNRCIASGLNL